MKKLLITLMVLAFVITVFTGGVFAQGPQFMRGTENSQARYSQEDRDFGVGYNRIELSEEQTNEIADLRNEFYNQTEELRDQLRDLRREIRDLEFRGASNAEIGEVEDRLEEVLAQMNEKRAASQEKMKAVLTEEQLNLIEENRFNYEERFQSRGKSFRTPRQNKSRGLGYGAAWCH